MTIPGSALLVATVVAFAAPAVHAHGETHAHGAAHGTHAGAAGHAKASQTPWGRAGDARAVSRTIEIRMGDDMRFVPDRLEIRQGETVRLVVRNAGQAMHELVLGTPKALEDHAAMMRRMPDMSHDGPDMAHVAPGRTGDIVWTFNRTGEFAFACLLPGHREAGMAGTIRVVARPGG